MPETLIGYKPSETIKPVVSVNAEMPQIREKMEYVTLSKLNSFDQRFAYMPEELTDAIAQKMANRDQDALFGTNL